MKKRVKFILLVLVLAAVIILAVILYPKLTEKYQAEAAREEVSAPAEIEAHPVEPLPPELMATDFTVYDVDGNPVSLSQQVGKPCIVNFWATWCKYCVEKLPTFDQYCAEYGDEINFMMVDLPDGAYETKEGALAFAAQEGYSFPVYFDSDGSASNAYGITGIPMTLLVNRDGSLLQTHVGLMDEQTLKGYIDELMK